MAYAWSRSPHAVWYHRTNAYGVLRCRGEGDLAHGDTPPPDLVPCHGCWGPGPNNDAGSIGPALRHLDAVANRPAARAPQGRNLAEVLERWDHYVDRLRRTR